MRKFRLSQEFITPYTPEQNWMNERCFLSLKEECVWLHNFSNKDEAFRAIADWIDESNEERPHSAPGYLSPIQFIEQKLVAQTVQEAGEHYSRGQGAAARANCSL